ncbi:MAG: TIGR02530 family flagellar biosynthesis protein [Fusobacteriota bacterium]
MRNFINQNGISGININKNNTINKNNKSQKKSGSQNISFKDLLDKKEKKLKFSSHAQKRINSRDLKIDNMEMQTLEKGINKLSKKGGRESVVLLNEKAYVVSVKNDTVITVMNGKDMKENVFTNIDSMIIMENSQK